MMKKYSKPKYILFMILDILLIVLLTVMLITGISLRKNVQKEAFQKSVETMQTEKNQKALAEYVSKNFVQDERISTEAIQNIIQKGTFLNFADSHAVQYQKYLSGEEKMRPELTAEQIADLIQENSDFIYSEISLRFLEPDREKLVSRLESPLKALNHSLGLLKALASVWLEVILILLLAGALAWMIFIHIRAEKNISTALKAYGMTACVPSVLMLILGMIILFLPAGLGKACSGSVLLSAAVGILLCGAVFGIGMLWNKFSKKPAEETISPILEEFADISEIPDTVKITEEVKRQFCRYCGKRLVNPDAQFCYQCGKPQK